MPVRCEEHERSLCASISGEIDHHDAKKIMTELEDAINHALPAELILDCKGITFMDSSGIAVLLRAWRRMGELEGRVRAIGVPAQAAKVLRAAGIERLIPFE